MAVVWQAITLLVKYLPGLIEAIKAGVDSYTVTIDLRKYDKAATKAEVEKDQRDLENIFHPGRHDKPQG
jgi:hypothetical protein